MVGILIGASMVGTQRMESTSPPCRFKNLKA
jgi:hypothetical protein